MIRRRYTPLLGRAFGALLTACSTEHVAPTPEGWLSANITGNAPATYRGTGFFQTMSDLPEWPDVLPSFFWLFSSGSGASAGGDFVLTVFKGARPEVGRYPLGIAQGREYDWFLSYTAERGDSVARFDAIDGEFEITASSAETIAGRFSFIAAGGLVCSKYWNIPAQGENGMYDLPCSVPATPERPTIQVNGSFNVVHGLPCRPYPDKKYEVTVLPKPVLKFCA
jgi:hypothetical protein